MADEPDPKIVVGGGCCLLWTIVFTALFGCAWSTLEPRQLAIVYDNVKKSIDRSHTELSGRHFIGVQKSYFKFPRGNFQYHYNDVGRDVAEKYADWMDSTSLNVWSRDGQTVLLGISMTIKLRKENLPAMYMTYGTDPYNVLRVKLMSSMKDVAVQFKTIDFFEERTIVKAALVQAVNEMLEDEYDVYGRKVQFFELGLLQLRSVELPHRFESKILEKLLALQLKNRATHKQQVDIKTAEIEEVSKRGDAIAAVTLAVAQSNGTKLVNVEQAKAQKRLYTARALKYGDLLNELQWTEDKKRALNFYFWSNLQRYSNSSKILPRIGVGAATLLASAPAA